VNFFLSYEKEHDLEINGWTFKRIGKNIYKIYRTVDPHSITMTGSEVLTDLTIPFPHRLIRLNLFHTSSTYVASTFQWQYRFIRVAGTLDPQHFEEYIIGEDNMLIPWITEVFGEGFEYEAGNYRLGITAYTSGELVFPVLYVQKLEAP
jgi:hypothetical protein